MDFGPPTVTAKTNPTRHVLPPGARLARPPACLRGPPPPSPHPALCRLHHSKRTNKPKQIRRRAAACSRNPPDLSTRGRRASRRPRKLHPSPRESGQQHPAAASRPLLQAARNAPPPPPPPRRPASPLRPLPRQPLRELLWLACNRPTLPWLASGRRRSAPVRRRQVTTERGKGHPADPRGAWVGWEACSSVWLAGFCLGGFSPNSNARVRRLEVQRSPRARAHVPALVTPPRARRSYVSRLAGSVSGHGLCAALKYSEKQKVGSDWEPLSNHLQSPL